MSNVPENVIPMVREWYKLKDKISELQSQERELRAQVVEACFEADKAGTQKSNLNDKTELVLRRSVKIDVDKDEFVKHKVHMEKKGLIGEDSVIKLEPKVSLTAYKYMSSEDKATFDSVFKSGFSSPQLDVKVKKD